MIVQGMHGLGDNLHQRCVIRELSKKHEIWLETSWPLVYWDMPEVRLLARGTSLRTQVKNAVRSAAQFTRQAPPRGASSLQVWYRPDEVKRHGSVLAAMCSGVRVPIGDFRMPMRPEWIEKADKVLEGVTKPVMFFRPLVERREWTGCGARNPRVNDYAALFQSIRDRFHVVSVADLEEKQEWLASADLEADQKFHRGELDAETIFGVAHRASLIFTSPGFATVLGQALSRPTVTVFGGYEDARSFSAGAGYGPWLALEPKHPCACWSHHHNCPKDLDVPAAQARLGAFVEASCGM